MNFTKTHILILTFAIVFFVGNDIFIDYLSRSPVSELDSLTGKISRTADSFSDSVFAKTDSNSIGKNISMGTIYPVASANSASRATSSVNFFGTLFELKEIVVTSDSSN